jgi:hypothetical protein
VLIVAGVPSFHSLHTHTRTQVCTHTHTHTHHRKRVSAVQTNRCLLIRAKTQGREQANTQLLSSAVRSAKRTLRAHSRYVTSESERMMLPQVTYIPTAKMRPSARSKLKHRQVRAMTAFSSLLPVSTQPHHAAEVSVYGQERWCSHI